MLVCGIDPGISGVISIIDCTTSLVRSYEAPTIVTTLKSKNKKTKTNKKRTTIDAFKLADIFDNVYNDFGKNLYDVYIEQIGLRPHQSAFSGITTGKNYGIYLGLLAAIGINVNIVTPKNWQDFAYKNVDKSLEGKERSEAFVNKRFPKIITRTKRGRLLGDLCDSLCIMEFGRNEILEHDNQKK